MIDAFSSGLLDVLAVALLVLALCAFFFYGRSRRSTPVKGSVPKASQRNVSALAGVAIIVPVVWFLLVWTGTSLLRPPIPPTPVPPTHTPTPSPPNMLAHDLVTPGMLTVGTDPINPPQEFLKNNQPSGFDIDLITAIAQKMHLQVKIVPTTFDSLLNDLNAKQFDVVISAVNMTDDRKTTSDFVPYFNASETLLVRAGDTRRLQQLADLCGVSVGVQKGTTEFFELQQQNATCQGAGKAAISITAEASEGALIQSLLQGTVEVSYQDTSAADYYMWLNPGKLTVALKVSAPPEGIVIRKGDMVMLNAVKNALASLKKDGTYQKLFGKWHLTSMEELAVVDRSWWYV